MAVETAGSFPLPTSARAQAPLNISLLHSGEKGWREYRKTGGVQRYARDRWWIKNEAGQWKKKARNRKDIPSLTEDEYEQWKARRAAARAIAKTQRGQETDSGGIRQHRQVVVG